MASLNILMDWALYYEKQGLSIIPIQGKIPLIKWSEYQEKRANEEQIKAWWQQWPTADIGCVTGRISNRLILDIDGDEGLQSIRQYHVPVTQSVRTRRGTQYHFLWSNTLDTTKTTITGILPKVDIRGEGGICILPPSKCSDGTHYEWIKDLTTPLAEIPDWLFKKFTENRLTVPESQEIQSKDPWLEEVLTGSTEGERHANLVRLAGFYFNSFSPDVAILHLREWNRKNTPPIDEQEFEEQIQDLKQRFVSGEYESTFKEHKTYSLVSATELVKQYSNKIEWLVNGLIPIGSNCILGGYQGLGKTFIATDLIIEISKKQGHGNWLGTFSTKHGSVLYIDNEMSPYLTSYRLRQLLKPKNLTTSDLDLFYSSRNRVKLTDNRQYMKLRQDIEKINPVLIVIDSFASCHLLDENSSADIRHFFDELIAPLSDEFGCAFLFLDHERKNQPSEHTPGNKRLRGSGAKGDAVDQVFSLDYQNGMLIFEQSKARYSKRHNSFVVNIDDFGDGIKVSNGGYLNE